MSQERTFFVALVGLSTVFSPFLMMLGQWRDSSLKDTVFDSANLPGVLSVSPLSWEYPWFVEERTEVGS